RNSEKINRSRTELGQHISIVPKLIVGEHINLDLASCLLQDAFGCLSGANVEWMVGWQIRAEFEVEFSSASELWNNQCRGCYGGGSGDQGLTTCESIHGYCLLIVLVNRGFLRVVTA